MKRPAVEWVVISLATSVAASLIMVTMFALYVALHSEQVDSARVIAVTQVLTGWGGGMLGVLGAYVGYSFGVHRSGGKHEKDQISPETPGYRPFLGEKD